MATTHPRFVDLAGAHNFRDLGGLPTTGGGRTRFGIVFRSDALHHLGPADVRLLASAGVRSIVDLRSVAEVERVGRGLLADEPAAWFHAPLSNGEQVDASRLPELTDGNLGTFYARALRERGERIAAVLVHLADSDNLPAVFHCTAGKDRTGIVAAVLLSLVGVERDAIVDDYALTDARMPLVMKRLRNHDELPDMTEALALGIARAEAGSMRTFLDELDERHGGARQWAAAAGVREEVVTRLHDLLVDEPG